MAKTEVEEAITCPRCGQQTPIEYYAVKMCNYCFQFEKSNFNQELWDSIEPLPKPLNEMSRKEVRVWVRKQEAKRNGKN